MIITKDDYIEMKVTMDQQATIKNFVNAIKPATTEINTDYYEELKANSDKWIEKETLHKPTNMFYIDMSVMGGGEEVEGDCKCGQSVSRGETYCHACGQKLDWSDV